MNSLEQGDYRREESGEGRDLTTRLHTAASTRVRASAGRNWHVGPARQIVGAQRWRIRLGRAGVNPGVGQIGINWPRKVPFPPLFPISFLLTSLLL